MGWTNPKTWVDGVDVLSASNLNTHVRDNLLALLGRTAIVSTVNIPGGTVLAAGQYWAADVAAPAGFTEANSRIVSSLWFSGASLAGVQTASSPQKLRPAPYWWPSASTVRVGVYAEAAYTFGTGYCRVEVLFHKV